MIEERLKAISDEMFEAQRVLPGRAELPDDDNRELMGVMRVGALAANTVLAGECEFMMVMMMKEKPTYQMLARIAKGLRKVFSDRVLSPVFPSIYIYVVLRRASIGIR